MESLALFMLASMAVIIAPGPDNIYVITRGIAGGRRAGVISAVGVTLGLMTHSLVAALGLAILLQTSVYAFWVIKIAGGLYLLYLGWQTIKNKEAFELTPRAVGVSLSKICFQGFMSNLLNPKIVLFFMAFLPQFVDPGNTGPNLQVFILGLIFALMTLVVFAVLGTFSGQLGEWLKKRAGTASKIRMGSGLTLILLGLSLILPIRK